jgi:hypothetical protein
MTTPEYTRALTALRRPVPTQRSVDTKRVAPCLACVSRSRVAQHTH